MLYGSVVLWNAIMFPDEDDKLRNQQRRQLHLILGKRPDGSIISMRFQGALSDALEWFGGNDIVHDINDVVSGKQGLVDKIKEAGEAPVQRIWHGSMPILKTIGEVALGRSTYPDVFFPRPIRDKFEHIARTFSLNVPYRWVAGKPKRGRDVTEQLFNDLLSLGFYTSEPGEATYFSAKKLVFDFLDKEGIQKPGFIPTDKSNALYYYKKSLSYGDLTAAHKYLKKYYELGGTRKGVGLSLKATHPIASIPKRLRNKFLLSLSPKEREQYREAVSWYRKVYLGQRRWQ